MTDVEAYFNREIEHAREMAQGDQREFWQGYCLGLLRGFLGPCAAHYGWHSRMFGHGAFERWRVNESCVADGDSGAEALVDERGQT